VFVNGVANLAHELDARIAGVHAARMATAAGAKSGLFGSFRDLEEAYLLGARPARRT
jgi:hypothetical protein